MTKQQTELEKLLADLVSTTLEAEASEREAKHLEAKAKEARDVARWSEINRKAAAGAYAAVVNEQRRIPVVRQIPQADKPPKQPPKASVPRIFGG